MSIHRWSTTLFLRHSDHQSNGVRQPVPLRQLLIELGSAGGGEGVELGVPSGFGFAPLGAEPALLLQPMERRVQRALRDLEDFSAGLFDAGGDRPAVHRLEGEGSENEEIEGALEEIGGFAHT